MQMRKQLNAYGVAVLVGLFLVPFLFVFAQSVVHVGQPVGSSKQDTTNATDSSTVVPSDDTYLDLIGIVYAMSDLTELEVYFDIQQDNVTNEPQGNISWYLLCTDLEGTPCPAVSGQIDSNGYVIFDVSGTDRSYFATFTYHRTAGGSSQTNYQRHAVNGGSIINSGVYTGFETFDLTNTDHVYDQDNVYTIYQKTRDVQRGSGRTQLVGTNADLTPTGDLSEEPALVQVLLGLAINLDKFQEFASFETWVSELLGVYFKPKWELTASTTKDFPTIASIYFTPAIDLGNLSTNCDLDGNLIGESICLALGILFYPSTDSLEGVLDLLETAETKFPFVYLFQFEDAIDVLFDPSGAEATALVVPFGSGELTLFSAELVNEVPFVDLLRQLVSHALWVMFGIGIWHRTKRVFNNNTP